MINIIKTRKSFIITDTIKSHLLEHMDQEIWKKRKVGNNIKVNVRVSRNVDRNSPP